MATTPAERKRAQRERASAAGKCIMCCKRKARAGKTTCKPCYLEAKERLYAARERARG
jgi:hypothetical protein